MPAPSFDVAQAHRWFAIELNNRTWDLIEAPQRSIEQNEEMLEAAHASTYHWGQCGQIINRARAKLLLATAYLAAGHASEARRYATASLDLCQQAGSETAPFDWASAWGSLAHASQRLGEELAAKEAYAKALNFVAQFEDPGDKGVFERFYPPL